MIRRKFLKNLTAASTLLSLSPFELFSENHNVVKLTILHTNDIHSRIEPFKDGRNKNKGGLLQLSKTIKSIKEVEQNVLLFDSGDIFQGTPYFNFYEGELEFKLMSKIGYDASTLGNHDFDNGISGLFKQLPFASFPFLCSNYNFSKTILKDKIKKFKIFKKQNIKVGVFGLGIELNGLVEKRLFGNIEYIDPLETAIKQADLLKNKFKCDLIICLSHLGYSYDSKKVSDLVIAKKTKHIDLILGGHTHTFLKKPTIVKNIIGQNVLVNQVGFGALKIGKIDYYFNKKNIKLDHNSAVINVNDFNNLI